MKQRICPLDGKPCEKSCPDRYPNDPRGGCILVAMHDACEDHNAKRKEERTMEIFTTDDPTMTEVATLLEDKKLSLMCSTSGMEAEDPSEGMELTFLDYKGKNPDTMLRITPALVDGTPIIKVETQDLKQQ